MTLRLPSTPPLTPPSTRTSAICSEDRPRRRPPSGSIYQDCAGCGSVPTNPTIRCYRYRLIDANEQAPIIEGEPLDAAGPVPYEKAVFHLEKRGETYLVTEVQYSARGKEKHARFLAFDEIAPGCYRPQ